MNASVERGLIRTLKSVQKADTARQHVCIISSWHQTKTFVQLFRFHYEETERRKLSLWLMNLFDRKPEVKLPLYFPETVKLRNIQS